MLVVHEASMSISGDSSFILNWESCGFSMYIQPDSLLPGESCDVSVKAMLGGDFELPKDTILVSGVYRVSLSRDLHKPVTLELEHCVDIKTLDDMYISAIHDGRAYWISHCIQVCWRRKILSFLTVWYYIKRKVLSCGNRMHYNWWGI